MEDIENGAGVMDGREGELVVVVIHNLELFEHVMDGLSKRNVLVSLEVIDNVLSGHVFVSHL